MADRIKEPSLSDTKRALCKWFATGFLRGNPGWHRTQDIAAGILLPHRAGANDDIVYLRDALYRLALDGDVEHQERQNGHLWRWTADEVCS